MKENLQAVYQVMEQVSRVIYGKEQEIAQIMRTFLAGGHVLLEDIPGVGKTTLALAFSKAMGLTHKRIQFTPDVLPGDLTGFSIYRRDQEKFVYQPGSVFCNLLLADEINRTSPKTQSALLEVMEERQVTVDGVTRLLPQPFHVIATQNPMGSIGTQRLPEAQEDRFMTSLSIGYPSFDSELTMALEKNHQSRMGEVETVMDAERLLAVEQEISQIYIKEVVARYAVELVWATRQHNQIARGGSPRATLALVQLAKAAAWMNDRSFVIPADVSSQFPAVIRHRLILTPEAQRNRMDKEQLISEILASVKRPSLGKKP